MPSAAILEQPYERLMQIAEQIEAREGPWRLAWNALLGSNGNARVERVKVATGILNAAIESVVDEIARCTNNSATTVRSVFRPRSDLEVWFGSGPAMSPSSFLRQVAVHRSFNVQYWWDRERAEEVRACEARATTGEALPADLAADAIAAGGVPIVAHGACVRRHRGSATVLEQALFLRRVLVPYLLPDMERWDRLMAIGAPMGQHIESLSADLSASRSFAFQQASDAGGLELVFWPIHRTARHQVRRPRPPLEAASDLEVADKDEISYSERQRA